jgi:hypothetical protein
MRGGFAMSRVFIHLSDIHIASGSDAVLAKAKKIVDSVFSEVDDVESCDIVFSGDIAQSGKSAEYQLAKQFVEELRAETRVRSNTEPGLFFVPGNHDCDLLAKDDVRDALISQLRESPEKLNSESIARICTASQGAFWDFVREVNPAQDCTNPWLTRRKSICGKVEFVGLNSAWVSTLPEQEAKLTFPTQVLVPEATSAELTIVTFHHPPNWFENRVARDLWSRLGAIADIVLLGHEHEDRAFSIKDLKKGSTVEQYLAHVLHDRKNATNSGFASIKISKDGLELKSSSFTWDGSRYMPRPTQSGWRPFIRNAMKTRSLSYSKEWAQKLEDPGAGFTHHLAKSSLSLSDLFVWPDLKESTKQTPKKPTLLEGSTTSGEKITEVSQAGGIFVFFGEEQYGKTTLLNRWAKRLNEEALYCLSLQAQRLTTHREKGLAEKIENAVELQYGKDAVPQYMQLDKSSRVLLLDDFHLVPLKNGNKRLALEALQKHFGTILLAAHNVPGFEFVLSDLALSASTTPRAVYEILPLSFALRIELIERWIRAGQSEPDEQETELQATRLAKFVDEALGKNLLPPTPMFVLLILQQSETFTDLKTFASSGSRGYLYEGMINKAINKHVKCMSIDAVRTFLTSLAQEISRGEEHSLSGLEFEAFHLAHCDLYDLEFSLRRVVHELSAAMILAEKGDRISFRYPYLYYYFRASSIAARLQSASGRAEVDELLATIHTEESANVLIFLAHLRADDLIADKLVAQASGYFFGVPESDLLSGSAVMSRFGQAEVRHMLPEANRSQLVQHYQESCADSDHGDKAQQALESATLDAAKTVSSMNAAFKTMQVLGQILRNRAGSISKEQKVQIANACVSLGLRALSFSLQFVSQRAADLLEYRIQRLVEEAKSDGRTLTDSAAAEDAARFFGKVVSDFGVGTLLKVASAVGSEQLSPTLKRILQNKGIARRTIDLAIRLEHFDDFPEDELVKVSKELGEASQLYALIVLRRFIIRRFYLFPDHDELKRRVCDRFAIARRGFQALEQLGHA